jgi:hypothetical protein
MSKPTIVSLYDYNTLSLGPHTIAQAMGGNVMEFSIFTDTAEGIAEKLNAIDSEIIGFSAYIWNFKMVKGIIPLLIQKKKIVGGPHVREMEHHYKGADIIVPGDVKVEYFDYSNIDLDKYDWVPFETSRGCAMGCGYCTWSSMDSKRMIFYDDDYVFKQLDIILSSKIKWLYLCDSSILFNKKRGKAILRHCLKYKKPIRFEFSVGQLDDELIQILLDMPESEFNFGIQTTNPVALKTIGRVFNKEDFEREYSALSGHHNVTIDVIYGLPNDNFEGYKTTIDYVASYKPKRILTNPLILLPGSPFWKDQIRHGFKWDPETHLVISNNTFSEDDMKKARNYSFKIVHGRDIEDAPDLVPTVKEGFIKRNRYLKNAESN